MLLLSAQPQSVVKRQLALPATLTQPVKQAALSVANGVRRFLREEDGQGGGEYALLVIVLLVFVAAGAAIFGPAIVRAFQKGADRLDSAGG